MCDLAKQFPDVKFNKYCPVQESLSTSKNEVTKLTAKDRMKKKKKLVNDKREKDHARTFHRPVS